MAAALPASAAARADLAVARLSVPRAVSVTNCGAAGCDVRLTARARVVNRGDRRARRARTGFFLSRDARRSRDDVKTGRRSVRAIRAGHARRARARLSRPGVATGTYRLIACADVTGRVRERDERNNCRASRSAITVQGSAPAAPTPPAAPAPCGEGDWRTDLCAELTAAMRQGVFGDMADAVTFALLYEHYRTGRPIPSSVAAGVIDPLRKAWDPVRGQAGLATYRVSGFLDFWVQGSYAGVDWARYPDGLDTPEEFVSWWQTYGIVQFTARQNAINHSLNAIVESEAAWQAAFQDWKAYDLKLVTAQQYSDATVSAHRTLEDAQTAVLQAENAIKGS